MTTSPTLTIDIEGTAKRTRERDGFTVVYTPSGFGRSEQTFSAKTERGTTRCQAPGTFGIGQCEYTGQPETVARVTSGGNYHDDTGGFYSVPDQEGAVVLHFCRTHSPAKKAAKSATQRTEWDFDYRHDQWIARLRAVTTERNARVAAAEAKLLDAARDGDGSAAWTLALTTAAAFLRAEIVASDTSAALKREAIEAEEPTR